MGNLIYQRIIIQDRPATVELIVQALLPELEPPGSDGIERLPIGHAEAECRWFDQNFGGFELSPETTMAALRSESSYAAPVPGVAELINNSVNVAEYFIDPNGCACGVVKPYNDGDSARFGDPAMYEYRREGAATVVLSRPEQYQACELYQRMVRHFGFISEQFGWAPDFFYTETAAEVDPEIAAEHAWVLRGRG